MIQFQSFTGTVMDITASDCNYYIWLEGKNREPFTFFVTPETYFVDHYQIKIGDIIVGYYNLLAPAVLIYPPRMTALVIHQYQHNISILVDYFDQNLIANYVPISLNIAPNTEIVQENNQKYLLSITNHFLIVKYKFLTKSIPAQTLPIKIIALCALTEKERKKEFYIS